MGNDGTPDARGMEMFERTHSSLIRAADGGNLTAAKWEAFGMRYRPVLVRYAKQILRLPHESAEDAVQNLLVKMWLSPHLIRRPPNGKFRYVLAAEYGVNQATVSRHIKDVEKLLLKDGERILGALGLA